MSRPFFIHRTRGFGLFDGMVSLALVAFGMLALTRFETRLSALSNDSVHRTRAAVLADELLNAMLTDNANANCYTLPPVTPCGNPTARAATDAWKARAMGLLPDAGVPKSEIVPATGRITVTLSWFATATDPDKKRTHQVVSDVR